MPEKAYIVFIVPKSLVKTVKVALEEHGKLWRPRKIVPHERQSCMAISTNINAVRTPSLLEGDWRSLVLTDLKLNSFVDVITFSTELRDDRLELSMRKADNLFSKGVRVGLQELSPELLDSLHVSEESLIRELPGNYSLYPPLLLLPKHTFAGDQWRALLLKLPDAQLYKFFKCMATAMSVTHVALNAPIPPSNNSKENILRSPTSLSPLYGDFGPVVTSINPIAEDFRSAFWVSTRQNGITQVWAPRYTMFSRGNITEKARVLALPSVREAVQQGRDDSRGCAAVDLYAGIGYFAFSYAKAGVSKVYCWELNPWSVEGFRRGAEQNKWGVQVIDDDLSGDEIALADAATFAVFKMDNLKAGPIIECSRKSIPPVRHVNCGLLPTSKGSWETAVKVLDPDLGGWLYLHENIAVHDVNVRSVEIHEEIQEMVNQKWVRERRTASLEHVERVKTYAPGIMHCVLDIRIS